MHTAQLIHARQALHDDEEFLTRTRAGQYGEPAQHYLLGLLTDPLTADLADAELADALIEQLQHDE
ncbi:hypothetical protein [Prauserella muralis]|uniref:Uncharacterized protein n=1 Tax=Prauserella muralis TaxID=588067 RepID=A0A2V4ABR8_9PSEU|nr:hypothetical protein [Prauserella muralis]PXY16539.1 hypothetical protein BAY60_35650 [Prauserella muralis]TWE11222.1 hypothetical protein FHX69_7444 [Prauserella muralis]